MDETIQQVTERMGTSMSKGTVNMGYGAEEPGPKLKMKLLVESPNIAEHLEQNYLDCLGQDVVSGYAADRSSRTVWEQRNEKAIKLALQVVEDKSFPWTNCSNVKFPLITIAALQFLSRVSLLTKGRQIVKCDVLGPDPDSTGADRAKRIGAHLSYQLVEEDCNWIDDDEKAKFAASIVGCAFKKTYFDSVEGVNVSEHVPASKLVLDYYTKDIKKANRITHLHLFTANDLTERERLGVFLPLDSDRPNLPQTTLLSQVTDEIQGQQAPASDSVDIYSLLEQHIWLDLDGDGYQEPYIVFCREDTGQVLRVVARYLDQGDVIRLNDSSVRRLEASLREAHDLPEQALKISNEILRLKADPKNIILRIVPQHFFTKIPFIPSPDGGFYDLGLGSMIGPLNESVNTLVNQLIDNGTMQNTAGGFLGRGVKIKGGKTSFDPFEWKPVDSSGDDLRKNIVPLAVQAPSNVLFELLGMLISYGERVSGSTDIMSGISPGQNTPAETSRNTIEQGMKIFSGIYGRMHRAFREELKKLVVLNQLYLEDQKSYYDLLSGDGAIVTRKDYMRDDFRVRPAADPATVSETQRQQKAGLVLQAAHSSPGYDLYLANREMLEAYDIPNIDQLLPDPKGPRAIPPPPNPKMELEMQKLKMAQAEQEMNLRLAMLDLQQTADLNNAKIAELQAKATKELAEANGVEVNQQIAAINAQVGAARAHQEGLLSALHLMQKAVQQRQMEKSDGNTGTGAARMETAPSNAGAAGGPAQP